VWLRFELIYACIWACFDMFVCIRARNSSHKYMHLYLSTVLSWWAWSHTGFAMDGHAGFHLL